MKKIKKTLITIGVLFASLSANAQLAESLGISIVPLDTIEKSSNELEKQAQDLESKSSTVTNKLLDNGNYAPQANYNSSYYYGLKGVGSTSGANSNTSENLAIAGAVGAGAYALTQTELGKNAIEAGKNLITGNDSAVQDAAKDLDVSSDALGMATGGSSPPPVTLLFGPTPNGDVFTFCNGPRPHWKSRWFSPYVYLCDGNPKKPGSEFIGFGVK